MKRAITLIEIVLVLVIVSFLSVASFKAVEKIAIRAYKAKELTKLTLEAQTALDQISALLAQRVPYTTIGYDPGDGTFDMIDNIQEDITKYKILEWISKDIEIEREYSGFLDLKSSIDNDKLVVDTTLSEGTQRELYFAGTFDRGEQNGDLNHSYGWHGTEHNLSFDIQVESDHNFTFSVGLPIPKYIYEKYYLAKSAYAIARGEDIDQNAECITKLHISKEDINDTLFLFFDYQPWEKETFCADPNGSGQEGNVTLLAQNITGFRVYEEDYTIRILLDINKTIRGTNVGVHFTKMKVVF